MPRIPLPHHLAGTSFRVGQSGLGEGRLRGPDLERPHYGVRAAAAGGIVDYAPLLRPDERFSHVSAALLWPLPLPSAAYPVHVTVVQSPHTRRSPARGRGIVGHTSFLGGATMRSGVPVSSPSAMFIELDTMLDDDDLVAVGDALVLEPHELDPHDIRPWITLKELESACFDSRSPGTRAARRALARVRQGAESRTETLLRLLLLRAGLPEPALGMELFDDRGLWIGRFDMVYVEARVIVEYDGDQHRSSTTQYEKDMTRIDRAIAAGWTVVRVRARGLFRSPEETIDRVRSALKR